MFFNPYFSYAEPFVRGVNYDPVHSLTFAEGMGRDDKTLMQQAIFDDLDNLKELQKKFGFKIKHIKVFFTQYSSLHNQVSINMADVVQQWNQRNPDYALTIALGVYEFHNAKDTCKDASECKQWTQVQIDEVKQALNDYKANPIPLIDRVVVGNEDAGLLGMSNRIAQDIQQVKDHIKKNGINNVTVGTAQTSPIVMDLYNGDKYQDILEAADFIGVNVYPFWGGTPYANAKTTFLDYWNNLKKTKNWNKKPVIETEEGWPSAGNALASPDNEHDYFNWWQTGHAPANQAPKPNEDYIVQTSYFFALNDKFPGQGPESNWGIFSADDSTNILENFSKGGKKLASNIVFPLFNNYIGADMDTHVVYSLKDIHPVIITACTEDNGQGSCYPLYGLPNSGTVTGLTVNDLSWDTRKNGYVTFYPGQNNQFMIDTSLQHYKSLYIVMNNGSSSYPGVCMIKSEALKQLNNGNQINIIWPKNGIPGSCL